MGFMFEDGDEFLNQDTDALLNRFEEMLRKNEQYFFDVEQFEELVAGYMEQRNLSRAMQVCKMGLSQHPLAVPLMIRKAQVWAATNHLKQAQDLLNRAEQLEPGNPEVFITRGGLFSQMGEYDKAIESYRQGLDKVEEKDEIYMLIAFEYQNKQDFERSAKYLRKAVAENANNEFALYELAYCYNMLNQEEQAADFYQEFLNGHPYSFPAWFNLGVAYSKLDLYEKAILAFDYALAIEDNAPSALYGKAQCLLSLSRHAEALEVLLILGEEEQPDAGTQYMLGECYENLQRWEEAEQAYDSALRLDDSYTDPYVGKAAVCEHKNDIVGAMSYLRKAIAIEPHNADLWYFYAQLLERQGELEEAETAFRKSIRYNPHDEDVWLELSQLLFNNHRQGEAASLLDSALVQHPDQVVFRYRLAACLFALGLDQEAGQHLSKALAEDHTQHNSLFLFYPEAKSLPLVNTLLSQYINKKE